MNKNKSYTYPEWLSQCDVSWDTLSPYIREYFLRAVGYDLNDDSSNLLDIPENEYKVRNWFYNTSIVHHIWCALGFYKARIVDETNDNIDMDASRDYLLMVNWIAKVIYEDGIDNDWWDSTITEEEFKDQNPWSKVI